MELEEVPKMVTSADSDKKSDGNDDVATAAEGTSGTESDKAGKEDKPDECPRSASPEPNCSICLGKLENKSFTDSCFHTFCFVCLLEWSKVKAVCPLCKQAFKSIIHNVRSFEDYDQYHLRTEEQAADELETRRFRFHSTMTNDRWWNHLRMEQQRQLALLRRPSRDTLATQWRRQRQAATSAYRRRIYASGMRVQEVRTATGRTMRYREVSPEFYRRNEACMHRLVPWLNRELNVLLNNHEDHVQFVLELIMDLIKRFHIRSEEFFQHIQPFTGRRTEHFIHEFHSFARSPYDMFAYDQRAVYNEPEDQPVHTLDSSDNDSSIHSTTLIDPDEDPDCILVSSPEPIGLPADEMATSQDHSYTSAGTADIAASSNIGSMPELSNLDLTSLINQVQSFVSGVDTRTPGESAWDSPTPGPSNTGPLNDLLEGTSSDLPIDVTETTPVVKVKEESNDGENSDSSDVVVVGYEKPWEERSPLQISSDDEEERRAAMEREQQERKRQKQKDKAKRHKKQRSRSHSHDRSRSHSHNRQQSKSKKPCHSRSRERSKSHTRHEQHRRRSHSDEHYKRDSRETTRDRLKDRNWHQRHSKDYASSRHSRSSRSKSPRYRHSRDNLADERDRRRSRDVRSPSLDNFHYSALGQYDYSDIRTEKSHRRVNRRDSEVCVTQRSRSPSEKSGSHERRRRHDSQDRPGKRSHKRSRSKSVEVIFRRRDRSKERHKKAKKHKHDRHSPVKSLTRDKHKNCKEHPSALLSPSDKCLSNSSPESRTDSRNNRIHSSPDSRTESRRSRLHNSPKLQTDSRHNRVHSSPDSRPESRCSKQHISPEIQTESRHDRVHSSPDSRPESRHSRLHNSPELQTDSRHNRVHCKKHPTGHKSSKHNDNRSEMSQDTNSDPQTECHNPIQMSENGEAISDAGRERHRSRIASVEEELLSSDSDIQVTRHQVHIENISSESDVSTSELQITSSSEVAIHFDGTGDQNSADVTGEGAPHLNCSINVETYTHSECSDAGSKQISSNADNDSLSGKSNNGEDQDESVKHSDNANNRAPTEVK